METDENDMKVEQSVSMHSHVPEQPCKRQIVTDPKSPNASYVEKITALEKRWVNHIGYSYYIYKSAKTYIYSI